MTNAENNKPNINECQLPATAANCSVRCTPMFTLTHNNMNSNRKRKRVMLSSGGDQLAKIVKRERAMFSIIVMLLNVCSLLKWYSKFQSGPNDVNCSFLHIFFHSLCARSISMFIFIIFSRQLRIIMLFANCNRINVNDFSLTIDSPINVCTIGTKFRENEIVEVIEHQFQLPLVHSLTHSQPLYLLLRWQTML